MGRPRLLNPSGIDSIAEEPPHPPRAADGGDPTALACAISAEASAVLAVMRRSLRHPRTDDAAADHPLVSSLKSLRRLVFSSPAAALCLPHHAGSPPASNSMPAPPPTQVPPASPRIRHTTDAGRHRRHLEQGQARSPSSRPSRLILLPSGASVLPRLQSRAVTMAARRACSPARGCAALRRARLLADGGLCTPPGLDSGPKRGDPTSTTQMAPASSSALPTGLRRAASTGSL